MTERIEAQVERFAPGFKSIILARHTLGPSELQGHNDNLIGGDINGGAWTLRQRCSRAARNTYRTPLARSIFVLIVDTAGRRRSWNGRLSRCMNCAVRFGKERFELKVIASKDC